MTPAQELVAGATALLIDFDGPLCRLMPPPANAKAADGVRAAIGRVNLPKELQQTTDHLAVLRYVIDEHPGLIEVVEKACTAVELEALRGAARPSVLAPRLVRWLLQTSVPAAIVSNNSDDVVRAYVEREGWSDAFAVYACRRPESVRDLKPSPELLRRAADALHLDLATAVFVGDSVSDVLASKAAGTRVVGLAKNAQRWRELEFAGADVVTNLLDQAALVVAG